MSNPRFHRLPSGLLAADTAVVLGDVKAAAGVNVWFGAVVRGDVAAISLGEGVNLQDGVIVHCDYDLPQVIEAGVVAGHAAVLHGVRIGADTLVGIGAKVLGGCDVGAGCVIAAGAVLAPGTIVPPRSVVMGVPGRVIRAVTDEELAKTREICRRYLRLAESYAAGEI